MTLYEKSWEILELPAILDMLAAEAVSDPAKAAAKELRPAGDTAEVRRRMAETTAAKELMVLNGAPAFSGVKDVSAALKRADAGGMLNTRELTDIAGVLRAARGAASYAADERTGERKKSEISHLFAALRANKYFEERVTNSIVGDGELADAASGELADIRRAMRVAGDRVRQALQKIITSPSYAKALQESIITVKNGRYVVPVKAEHRAAVPGLIHDVSASGATLFIEPMSAVKANNEIRELLAKEEREVERILRELSAEAASFAEEILLDVRVLTALDLIFAKAKLSYAMEATEPALSGDGTLELKKARHPLLDRHTAVPIDARLGGAFDTLVITGPNTGGKTVTLKTLGLLALMAACGLHIPADDGSALPVFRSVLADIGDEQSIEQSLSTFSSHMTNIAGILEEAGEGSLVLLDELGAGTDPAEGAALAVSIIEYLRRSGALVAATTHYAELKIYAMTEAGVMNASCEFDVQTLRPTYRLLMGIPGKSNAFAISERIGLPAAIIADAKRRVDTDDADFEAALGTLEAERIAAERSREEAERALASAREKEKEAEALKAEAAEKREKAEKLARREARKILSGARAAADETFKELNEMRKTAAGDWQKLNDAKSDVRRALNEAEEQLDAAEEKPEAKKSARPAAAGDVVEILSLGTKADVLAVLPDGSLELQAGILKVTLKQEDVYVLENERKAEVKTSVSVPRSEGAMSSELDLRGMTAMEAEAETEKFIDAALLRHVKTVTIIHGKGTGVLRETVQKCLRKNKQVRTFRPGRYGEGEAGVTVAELV